MTLTYIIWTVVLVAAFLGAWRLQHIAHRELDEALAALERASDIQRGTPGTGSTEDNHRLTPAEGRCDSCHRITPALRLVTFEDFDGEIKGLACERCIYEGA